MLMDEHDPDWGAPVHCRHTDALTACYLMPEESHSTVTLGHGASFGRDLLALFDRYLSEEDAAAREDG
jgi:hypothetical protein